MERLQRWKIADSGEFTLAQKMVHAGISAGSALVGFGPCRSPPSVRRPVGKDASGMTCGMSSWFKSVFTVISVSDLGMMDDGGIDSWTVNGPTKLEPRCHSVPPPSHVAAWNCPLGFRHGTRCPHVRSIPLTPISHSRPSTPSLLLPSHLYYYITLHIHMPTSQSPPRRRHNVSQACINCRQR
jgi:hypothetical protein